MTETSGYQQVDVSVRPAMNGRFTASVMLDVCYRCGCVVGNQSVHDGVCSEGPTTENYRQGYRDGADDNAADPELEQDS